MENFHKLKPTKNKFHKLLTHETKISQTQTHEEQNWLADDKQWNQVVASGFGFSFGF